MDQLQLMGPMELVLAVEVAVRAEVFGSMRQIWRGTDPLRQMAEPVSFTRVNIGQAQAEEEGSLSTLPTIIQLGQSRLLVEQIMMLVVPSELYITDKQRIKV